MKKFTLLFLLISFCVLNLFSQTKSDSIYIEKKYGLIEFYQNGKILSSNRAYAIISENYEAAKELEKAKRSLLITGGIVYMGSYYFTYLVRDISYGTEEDWRIYTIAGVGVMLFTIPLFLNYNKRIEKAVGIYNSGLKE